jgi:hypothetical protein
MKAFTPMWPMRNEAMGYPFAERVIRTLISEPVPELLGNKPLYGVRTSDEEAVKARGVLTNVWEALKQRYDEATVKEPLVPYAIYLGANVLSEGYNRGLLTGTMLDFYGWAIKQKALEKLAWIPEARTAVAADKLYETNETVKVGSLLLNALRFRAGAFSFDLKEWSTVGEVSATNPNPTGGPFDKLMNKTMRMHPLLPGLVWIVNVDNTTDPRFTRDPASLAKPLGLWTEVRGTTPDFENDEGTEHVYEYLTKMKPRE